MRTDNSNSNQTEISELISLLKSENGIERKNARDKLVAKGKVVIEYLNELLDSPKHLHRWEAVKTLEEIAEPDSIPILIQALDDDKSDVRWIAAEGLIKIGKQSLKPLLKALTKKTDSVFLLEGAHHVFFELREKGLLPADFPTDELLSLLKDPEMNQSVKPLADKIIDKFNL